MKHRPAVVAADADSVVVDLVVVAVAKNFPQGLDVAILARCFVSGIPRFVDWKWLEVVEDVGESAK